MNLVALIFLELFIIGQVQDLSILTDPISLFSLPRNGENYICEYITGDGVINDINQKFINGKNVEYAEDDIFWSNNDRKQTWSTALQGLQKNDGLVASVQITCTTNTPSATGAYSWDWANNNANNYGTSVGASCTISGVPLGATILSVQYYIDGQLINSNDSPTDHGAAGFPLCDEIYLRVNGPGTLYDVIDIGYTGSDCNNGLINWAGWTGSNTASPNGTYYFDWGSAAEYGPAQDYSVSQIKVVVTYDDGQGPPCPTPNCGTVTVLKN